MVSGRPLQQLCFKPDHVRKKPKMAVKRNQRCLMVLTNGGDDEISETRLNASIPALLPEEGCLPPQVGGSREHRQRQQPPFDSRPLRLRTLAE
jgi:hypothetical protein